MSFPVFTDLKQIGIKFENLVKIGQGAERSVYIDKTKPNYIIKLSKIDNCLQTKREIKFYNFLYNKKISLKHLPIMHAVIKNDKYIGSIQENISTLVANDGKTFLRTVDLPQFLKTGKYDKEKLSEAFCELKNYLLSNNLVVCDLLPHNIKVRCIEDENSLYYILFLVDGFGSKLWLPFDLLFKSKGRRHILKQWQKLSNFLQQDYGFILNN